jgi:hypothetical protein
MKEPSVLDYVKSLLMPWKGTPIQISQPETKAAEPASETAQVEGMGQDSEPPERSGLEKIVIPVSQPVVSKKRFWLGGLPYRAAAALILAIFAQMNLEPPLRNVVPAVVLYGIAGLYWIWALSSKELQLFKLSDDETRPIQSGIRYPVLLALCIPIFFLAYFAFSDGKFTEINLFIELVLLITLIVGLYQKPQREVDENKPKFKINWGKLEWNIRITPWIFLIIVALVVITFFRFYRLQQVPVDMISDQAEKLFDVNDVLSGQMNIFFPRNSGREAFQFYLTAAVIRIFGTGISFLSLKIGTGLAGMVTLIYIYLLGKEVGNRQVGLFAVILTGVAYWPNVIDRIGLRFALYPLFTAPALYYLIRGLRRQNRNDFIWSGIALGLGLHGYSTMRIVPFVFIILILVYIVHRQARGKRITALQGLVFVGVVSLVVLLPLIRYALEKPGQYDMVTSRAFSRLSTTESVYPAPPVQIFFQNLWNAWTMTFYDNGMIWAHSIPSRPALDFVTAGLYFLGSLAVIVQYFRTRHWLYLFLLILVPLLMMPSILSLAFPNENPSLNRTGAAYIPVFILAALGLDSILSTLFSKINPGQRNWAIGITATAILLWVSLLNYDLVFNQYATQYAQSSWNTAEMGQVVKSFISTFGENSSVYVVGYPYWVDGRSVALESGVTGIDFSIVGARLPETMEKSGTKLFLLSPEDQPDLTLLETLYPEGQHWIRAGRNDKNFVEFLVLAPAIN